MRRPKAVLESELENLQRMCADGFDSPTIRAGITTREAELSAITSKTLGRSKGSVQRQVVGLRKFVRESLADIRKLLAGEHSDPAIVKQELARHIDAITLLPGGKGDAIRYKGEWKVLGKVECAEGAVSSVSSSLPEVTIPFEGAFTIAA
jgi:hypothetical protein